MGADRRRRRRRPRDRKAFRFRRPELPTAREVEAAQAADVADAVELARQLGGTDEQVKSYFLSLGSGDLRPVLEQYEDQYGHEARGRTEVSLPAWRTGSARMSARMTQRLYRLLPPRMPAQVRYDLAEKLWRHVGPSSRETFRMGLDVDERDVVRAITDHLDQVVAGHHIPAQIERRFKWLTAADVQAKQDLLNEGNELEKSLLLAATQARLPIILAHMRAESGDHTRRVAQLFSIGKNRIELVLDRDASGLEVVQPTALEKISRRYRLTRSDISAYD